MPYNFQSVIPIQTCAPEDWSSWGWQIRNSLKTQEDFAAHFELTEEEQKAFTALKKIFRAQTTPYYASLASRIDANDPIRKMLMPHAAELSVGLQQEADPLGENKIENRPAKRLVHRYSDRALFLVTDFCSVYCRFCTRKHFTASDSFLINNKDYEEALNYIRNNEGVREVILSGGDPLTLSDSVLLRIISDLRKIKSVEVIRVHTRMPVVCPMRITSDLVKIFRTNKPVYLITHFNHPKEITVESAQALELLADSGVPVLNQMVLLNGINNHPALVAALSRRLLYLRVKPYYMFQCDPSPGTDHLRTSIEDSRSIQKELWGHLSGLAIPTLILDLPNGGGKVPLVPDFPVEHFSDHVEYTGWDGVKSSYYDVKEVKKPAGYEMYLNEWNNIKDAKAQSSSD